MIGNMSRKLAGCERIITHVKNQTKEQEFIDNLFRNKTGYDPDKLTYRGDIVVPSSSVLFVMNNKHRLDDTMSHQLGRHESFKDHVSNRMAF